jgi:predicted membrane protein
MRAGARYVVHAPELRTVLTRTAVFIIPGSAIWALLPVLVRELGRGPLVYGILLGALGAGGGASYCESCKTCEAICWNAAGNWSEESVLI